jgi:hypothetical protein
MKARILCFLLLNLAILEVNSMWLSETGANILLEFLNPIVNDQNFTIREYTDKEKEEAEKMLKEVKRFLKKVAIENEK